MELNKVGSFYAVGTNLVHETAVIYWDHVTMCENNVIGPLCVIGAPAEYKNPPNNNGRVVIGSGNTITGQVSIDRGLTKTVIGNGCYLMKKVHIGHDCEIHNNVTISPMATIGGHTIVMDGVNIGMGAAIHQKQVLGAHCMIGMNTVIVKGRKVWPFYTYVGVHKQLGKNEVKYNLFSEEARKVFVEQFSDICEW